MKRYEIAYRTTNGVKETRPITALMIEPDTIGPDTGVLLVTHGWGPNRFQHEDKMRVAAEEYNLVCLAVEYRQSGYACDPVGGYGWDCPYDASFYQVLDVLNGLRFLLETRLQLDRSRLIHYGGSQGGHIALPQTVRERRFDSVCGRARKICRCSRRRDMAGYLR